jgi:4-hydroxybutyryl-CoA dehydratase/vinylacetyl-CoA-Delta-isomerase
VIKTAKQYMDSLRDGRVVYFDGERIKDVTTNPRLRICGDWCALTYAIAEDPRYRKLYVEKDENGEEYSFVFKAAKSAEDLIRRREINKLDARICYGKTSGGKFTGVDAMNAVTIVCGRIDRKFGTHYSENVRAARERLKKNDLSVVAAVTDVKGDRSLRPSKQQTHKDYYVRVVDRRRDGIIVRGAKAHITNSPFSNEVVAIPCRRHLEEDKDYAVAFTLPLNTKGLTMVSSHPEIAEADVGNYFDFPITASIYLDDALIVFDDVFVPNENIFMAGEWQYSADMAYMFANFHRLSADTYKTTELEVIIGSAALMAEYNGLERDPIVREKLAWLAVYAELAEVLGMSACNHCVSEHDSDLVYPNPMYSNMAKFLFADLYHQAVKHTQDISGGLVATIPSSKDFFNPQTRPLIEKYFGGKHGIPTEHRIRATRLVRDLTSSYEAVATIHAEGSLAAQKMSIYNTADWNRYKAAAKRAARIDDGTVDPIFSGLPRFPEICKEKIGY